MQLIKILLLIVLLPGVSLAQYNYASRIMPLPALPANCSPNNGDVVMYTVAPTALYVCTDTNQWRPAGFTGNGMVWDQGTLTASTPIISHTATWNNGGATFIDDFRNITDTASAAGSYIARWQVSGNDRFVFTKTGDIQLNAASVIASPANGVFRLTTANYSDFTRLALGPQAVTHPALTVSAAVAGQSQGIIITKADGSNFTFANLGAATNGSMLYCSDCTVANPCAGAGTGALAKRLNGAWVCN